MLIDIKNRLMEISQATQLLHKYRGILPYFHVWLPSKTTYLSNAYLLFYAAEEFFNSVSQMNAKEKFYIAQHLSSHFLNALPNSASEINRFPIA